MNFIKRNKNTILLCAIAVLILTVSFFAGGNNKDNDKKNKTGYMTDGTSESVVSSGADEVNSDAVLSADVQVSSDSDAAVPSDASVPSVVTTDNTAPATPEVTAINPEAVINAEAPAPEPPVNKTAPLKTESPVTGTNSGSTQSVTNNYTNNTVPHDVSESVSAKPAETNTSKPEASGDTSEKKLTCTLEVICHNALGKVADEELVSGKNGVIYSQQNVEFYEGESVFNILVREMKKNKIHLEFVNIPVYKSAYIEGIGNLYEFDCGELSGWMYKVNGYFPDYGSSQYQIKQGDKIEWVYTCDLGKDVGGEYSARNGLKR